MENMIGYNNTLSGHYVGPWSVTKRIMDGTRLMGYSLRNQESDKISWVERDVFDTFLEKHKLEIPNKSTIGKLKYDAVLDGTFVWKSSEELERELNIYLSNLVNNRLSWYIKKFRILRAEIGIKGYNWDNFIRESSLKNSKVLPAIGENLNNLVDEIMNKIVIEKGNLVDCMNTNYYMVNVKIFDDFRKSCKKAYLQINELMKSEITNENIVVIDNELKRIKVELDLHYPEKAYKRGEKIKRK